MKKKVRKVLKLILICLVLIVIGTLIYYFVNRRRYPRMTFMGHASVKIVSLEGTVIYIDPFFPKGNYKEPADYILVTHEHSDHNKISLCRQAEGCQVIHYYDALKDGAYQIFEKNEVKIEAVPSGGGNTNHSPMNCVGFIITVDGISIYHAGDTSKFDGLNQIAGRTIDYAMYPVDGKYNMGPEEAGEVADMIGAIYNIPIHGDGKNYFRQRKEFHAKGKLTLHWGQTIFLKKKRIFL